MGDFGTSVTCMTSQEYLHNHNSCWRLSETLADNETTFLQLLPWKEQTTLNDMFLHNLSLGQLFYAALTPLSVYYINLEAIIYLLQNICLKSKNTISLKKPNYSMSRNTQCHLESGQM